MMLHRICAGVLAGILVSALPCNVAAQNAPRLLADINSYVPPLSSEARSYFAVDNTIHALAEIPGQGLRHIRFDAANPSAGAQVITPFAAPLSPAGQVAAASAVGALISFTSGSNQGIWFVPAASTVPQRLTTSRCTTATAFRGGFLYSTQGGLGEQLWFTQGSPTTTQLLTPFRLPRGVADRRFLIDDSLAGGARAHLHYADTVSSVLVTTDGTPAGTTSQALASSRENSPLLLDGGNLVWLREASPPGTVELVVTPASDVTQTTALGRFTNVSSARAFDVVGSAAWFALRQNSGETVLVGTDGTAAGSNAIAAPGPSLNRFGDLQPLAELSGSLAFLARSAIHPTLHLFLADHTNGTSTTLRSYPGNRPQPLGVGFNTWAGNVDALSIDGNRLIVNDGTGWRLFDGDSSRDVVLARDARFRELRFATPVGRGIVFTHGERDLGAEPWIADANGVRPLIDLDPRRDSQAGSDDSIPLDFVFGSERIWFTAEPDGSSRQLWSSDGTTAGTAAVPNRGIPLHQFSFRGQLFVVQRPPSGDVTLSVGLPDGNTVEVGTLGATVLPPPLVLPDPDGFLLAVRPDPSSPTRMFRWDGSQLHELADLPPSSSFVLPTRTPPVWLGDRHVFAVGLDLVVADPWLISARTFRLPGSPRSLAAFGGFFWALLSPSSGAQELLRIDPASGSIQVTTLGSRFRSRQAPLVATSTALFVADDRQLYVIDPTGNSRLVQRPFTRAMVRIGDDLLLATDDGVRRVEASGNETLLLGLATPSRGFIVANDREVWFGLRPSGRTELWVTDGTAAGTRAVTSLDLRLSQDIDTDPGFLLAAGQIWLRGDDGQSGFEPFVVRPELSVEQIAPSCGVNRSASLDVVREPNPDRLTLTVNSTAGSQVVCLFSDPPVRSVSVSGCELVVRTDLPLALPSAQLQGGKAVSTLQLPNLPALLGVALHMQALAFPTNGSLGFDLTDGQRVEFGR